MVLMYEKIKIKTKYKSRLFVSICFVCNRVCYLKYDNAKKAQTGCISLVK